MYMHPVVVSWSRQDRIVCWSNSSIWNLPVLTPLVMPSNPQPYLDAHLLQFLEGFQSTP
jgi:hypothetical protein